MTNTPDRLTADLRRYEREQEEAEREYRAMLPELRAEAARAVRDVERLKLLLDDEALAVPLATICTEIQGAITEFSFTKFPNGCASLARILVSAHAIKRELVHLMTNHLEEK